uniref:Uncharacterized protein n=1 Tax=Arundo donax TaxID=35708 RepID=A0A0A8YIH6_ARUDO
MILNYGCHAVLHLCTRVGEKMNPIFLACYNLNDGQVPVFHNFQASQININTSSSQVPVFHNFQVSQININTSSR